ncbi:MAG TPA: phage tail assembly chaperone [Aliiroseovarius sp.]|nr:phage tail assembly chaperone [Aliiroseovarius sp.]
MAEPGGFDWPALMRLGLVGLGLSPAEFWALTPSELVLKLGLDNAQAPMGRARLQELAQAFPDHVSGLNEGEKDG